MLKINFKILIFFTSIFCCTQSVWGKHTTKRLLCYYDATTGLEKNVHLTEVQLVKALPYCTHLMYGYAQILTQTYNVGNVILKPDPALLKLKFPHLKIFLTLGGDDKAASTQSYLQLLEADKQKKNTFIENVKNFLVIHHFDGIDLAFPFPRNKPSKVHSSIGLAFKQFKKMFTGDEVVDQKANDHKQQYTELVDAMKAEFAQAKLQMAMTVLPNVNSSCYFDIFKIHKNFEFINLFAFDFVTPLRNPEEADYTAPIDYKKDGSNRKPYANVDYQVKQWLHNGCPESKLNLGIPTYGQAWKITKDSGLSGVPVVSHANGPADCQGVKHKTGVLSLSEICAKLRSKDKIMFKFTSDSRKYGTYAFRPATRNGESGIWISYDFAGAKAEYVNKHNMSGVALFDLKHDDFQAVCKIGSFPILQRIAKVLGLKEQIKRHYVQ